MSHPYWLSCGIVTWAKEKVSEEVLVLEVRGVHWKLDGEVDDGDRLRFSNEREYDFILVDGIIAEFVQLPKMQKKDEFWSRDLLDSVSMLVSFNRWSKGVAKVCYTFGKGTLLYKPVTTQC
jgi:hypothetical protein